MNLTVITPPEEEPVSVETAKQHMRVDHSADDALIQTYLVAAREYGEGLARRAFVTQTLRLVVDTWPAVLKLPRPPLQSVESVTYLDRDGVTHEWAAFTVDNRSDPGRVIFTATPNALLAESGAISVEFVAGYGAAAAVPSGFVQAILLTATYWYENREAAMDIPAGAKNLYMANRGSWF